MPKTIQYFMWPYQDLFRAVRAGGADRLFSQLASGLDPQLFLVGFLVEDRDDRHPICVEPEEDFWLTPEDLVEVLNDADVLRSSFPESQLIQSHPEAARRFANRLDGQALRGALVATLNEHPNKPTDSTFFASFPERVDGFDVVVVIGLNKHTIESFPRLKTDKFWIHDYQSQDIPCSLIESAVDVFLEDCGGELRQAEPGPAGVGSSSSEQRLLQDAAKRMVSGLAMRCDTWNNTLGAYANSFENFCRIAAMGYEKAEATGRLALARLDHPAVSKTIEFVDPVPLRHHRHARKLLEVCRSKSLSLHTNSADCWGFAKVDRDSIETDDLFEIVFVRRFVWQCYFQDQLLFVVDNGTPHLAHPAVDRARLREDLIRVLPMLHSKNMETIINLIGIASQQEHGTVVLISSEAESEAARLKRESTAIVPVELEPESMLSITGIDGAVILDADGRCHAIGAILDGLATDLGDPSRGARYNSMVRYLQNRKTPALGVIISEDGSVDVFPKLRPAIARSEIDHRLDDLRKIAEMTKVPRRYAELAKWFDDYRFYLLEPDCDELNQLIPKIELTRSKESEAEIRVSRRRWEPNISMRADWFYKNDGD